MEEEVSGRSVFWALTAIILNAMLQPSCASYTINGSTLDGSLWPIRSSPVICVYDALTELRIMFGSSDWRTAPSRLHVGESSESHTTSAIMKLAVFLLGVLPQAVKLFSMRGIPLSQALAAVYLGSSLINLFRSFGKHAHEDMVQYVQAMRPVKTQATRDIVLDLHWVIHVIGAFVVWYHISGEAHIEASENVKNGVDWVYTCVTIGGFVYILQHTTFMLLAMKPPIPRSPAIIVTVWTNCFGIPGLLKCPECRKNGGVDRIMFAIALLLSLSIACYLLAYFVWLAMKRFMSLRSDVVIVHEMTSVINAEDDAYREEHSQEDGDNIDIVMPVPDVSAAQEVSGADQAEAVQNLTRPEQMASDPVEDTVSAIIPERQPEGEATADPTLSTVSGQPEKEEEALGWVATVFVWMAVGAFFPLMILLVYSGLWDFDARHAEEEAHIASQSNVEEARHTAASRNFREKLEDVWRGFTAARVWSFSLAAIQWPIRFAIRVVLTIVWRLVLSFLSLFEYTGNWYAHIVQKHPMDVLLIAFGAVNLVTIAIVYLCLFDPRGTFNPSWNRCVKFLSRSFHSHLSRFVETKLVQSVEKLLHIQNVSGVY